MDTHLFWWYFLRNFDKEYKSVNVVKISDSYLSFDGIMNHRIDYVDYVGKHQESE